MPKEASGLRLTETIAKGVIIHSFSDLSGVAFYNSATDEICCVGASADAIYDCYAKYTGSAADVDQEIYAAFLSLLEKGMFKLHEHD